MKRILCCCLPLFALFGGVLGEARADIYKYVDKNGVVHFTNTPNQSHYQFFRRESGSDDLADIIRRHAAQFRLEEALVRAVIRAESNFDPRAVSPKGALGMMQLIPGTARLMNVHDPMNPEENIRGGSRYLRLMLDEFGDNLELALAAYNAGPGAVKRHGGIPPYAETRTYVERVKRYLDQYRLSKDTVL